MTDDLRQRLARLDPLQPETIPADPPDSLLEQIMAITTNVPTPPAPGPAPAPSGRATRRVWPVLVAAAAAVALFVGVAGVVLSGDDPAEPPLVLGLPDGGGALASCLPFDVAVLAQMPLAFEGRAVEVTDGPVTLDVTRWYRGGDATQVTLAAMPDAVALIDGIDFVAGGDYLITATDGQVNFCGYSTPATDEMRAAFASAFPG
jgi:hypothetical protein